LKLMSKFAPALLPVVVYNMNTPVDGSVQPARPRVEADVPAADTAFAAHVTVVDGNPAGRAHVPDVPFTMQLMPFAVFE